MRLKAGRKRGLLRAEKLCHQLLQNESRSDRADDRGKVGVAAFADRPKRKELKQHAQNGGNNQSADERNQRAELPPQHDLQAGKGADHQHFAVREMQEPQDAEYQRISDRNERVGAAKHHAIRELLRKHRPALVD